MVKAYLRYEPCLVFGIIASLESNIAYDYTGKHILSPALNSVAVWDPRRGELSKSLSLPLSSNSSHKLAVTSIASSPKSPLVASGHKDGSVRLWDLAAGTCEATFNGHRSAAVALRFSGSVSVLASGGKDCDIILWDIVGEAGLFRLRGHRDQVTDLTFMDSDKKLVSCSKDKFVRVWDLELQQCIQLVGGHHAEIWSLDVSPDERYLVTGSADKELRIFQVQKDAEGTDNSSKWEVLKSFGEIQRNNGDRVGNLRFDKSGKLLACQAAGKEVEIYAVLDDTEARRKAKRRLRRKKEKVSAKASIHESGDGSDINPLVNQDREYLDVIAADVFKPFKIPLKVSKKITSMTFSPNAPKGGLATLSLSLSNNMLETYLIEPDQNNRTHRIDLPGHRSAIRSLSLSSDNTMLMSTSHNEAKIWNPSTGACIRTMKSEYGVCSSFVLKDQYALVGTKEGKLEVFHVGSGSLLESKLAHGGQVISVVTIPGDNGFVTGSLDREVKFWGYCLDRDSQKLTVTEVRRQEMNDEVLALSISPDAKYIAVSLSDLTVKVYFMDTFKLFLSLYGHKLPVLCMDISSDGDLIVTGSADKNLKIWGLDFGDCHKSIFAHADGIAAVRFVCNTHYMFSAGKDNIIKYWDADKFELLLTLEGHHAQVWCLVISSRGDFIVSGSLDRSIRRWDRTEEPFFIEEEREKRLEEMFEADLDNANDDKHAPKEDLPEEGAVGLPGKKTRETLTATDLIIDALDIAEEELKRIEQHKEDLKSGKGSQFQANILLQGLSPSDYVLETLSKVQTNDLEQTLLSLTFSDALKLISYLKDWVNNPDKVELVCRITVLLLQINHNQLTAVTTARPMLVVLKDILHARVKECKDTIGFNLAAMNHLKELMSMRSDAPFRDVKERLTEIRREQSKRTNMTQAKERRKKKKQKTTIEPIV